MCFLNLQDSLGGLRQTAMIANSNPIKLSLVKTQNTWYWGNGSKEIRKKVCFVITIGKLDCSHQVRVQNLMSV